MSEKHCLHFNSDTMGEIYTQFPYKDNSIDTWDMFAPHYVVKISQPF